jgi:scyllo-inositol 2-dehydrogenase (NADP+)
VLQLFGQPESITLDMAVQRDDGQADDWFHCLMHFGEMRVILHGSVLTAAPAPRFAIHGTKGSYVKYGLDPQEIALRDGERPRSDREDWGLDQNPGTLTLVEPEPLTEALPSERGDYRLYYAGIRDAILKGAPSPVPAHEAAEVVKLIELGYQSHAEGRRIKV